MTQVVNLKRLKRAGLKASGKRWLRVPLRRLLWPVIRPYFEQLAAEVAATPPRLLVEQAVNARFALLEKEVNLRTTALTEGAQKDFKAFKYRLASIEEALIGTTMQQLKDRVATFRLELTNMKAQRSPEETPIDAPVREFLAMDVGGTAETQQSYHGEVVEWPATGPRGAGDAVISITGTSLRLVSGKYGRYLLRHPDLIGDAIMRGEFWDQYLKDVIEQNGDPHGLAIDAGAYIGLHTIHLSRHFRQVYAFEPQTQIYRMLSANILLNERQNVLAFNKALYDRPGLMQIASPGKQEIPVPRTHGYVDYHLVKNAAAISFETVEGEVESAVPAITIDSLKLDRVSFIKVDTQGSDLRVLQGAEQTIVRCRPTIVFEFERELTKFHGNELSDYEGYFESIGYELTVVSNRGNGKQIDYLARPR